MKKPLFYFCLFSVVFSLSAQEKKTSDFSEAFRLMDTWLEAQVAYDKLPSLSVAVVKDQEIIYRNAFGMANIHDNVAAKTNTIYSICSISKLFTAVAIMKLWDEGKLRLDDEIQDVLPWYNLEQQYKDSGPITIRSLLSHSSGLPRESDFPYWTGPDFPFPSQEEIQEKLGTQETLYPASTYFQYSNLGLTLLGEIIEEVSGKTYEDFVEENILKPLRLKDTRSELPEKLWGSQMAVGYGAIKRDGSRDQVQFFQADGIKPAAGFSSTVEDLALFASWQFRLLENGGREILKASTLKDMQRVHFTDPGWNTTRGLGFGIYRMGEKTIVGHGGSCPGYRSVLYFDNNEKMAVVVMINAGGTNPGHYGMELMDILAKAGSGKEDELPANLNFEDYTGLYSSQPWWSEKVIVTWKGKLAIMSLPSENPSKALSFLKHMDEDTFRRVRDDETLGEEVVFERDKTGKVVRYRQHSNNYYKQRN